MFSKSSLRAAVAVVACAFTLSLASHAEVSAGSKSARVLITQKIDETKLVTLEGNTPREARIARYDRGPVAEDFHLDMQMQLKRSPEQQKAMGILMDQLHTPGSPNYHKWLSEETFDESFGVNVKDVEQVKAWLESHGFKIEGVSTDGMVISYSGTAAMAREAFHTEIHKIVSAKGKEHFANMSDPKIPAAFADVMVGSPLNNYMPHPLLVPRVHSLSGQQPHAEKGPTGEYTYSGCGFVDYVKNQTTYDANCYAFTPGDAAKIYNINPLYALTTPITGTGQTVGVIEDSNNYSNNDYASYVSAFFPAGATNYGASSSNLSTVHPTGSSTCTNPGDLSSPYYTDEEVELDMEAVTAVAPAAKVIIESCADTSTVFGGLIAVQNLASATTIAAPVISISYGFSESENGATSNTQYFYAYEHAVARGMSVFVSSGDEGAASSDADLAQATHGITVSGFASTPYNVAVGGTDFGDLYAGTESSYWSSTNAANYSSALSYVPEIPWADSCASSLITTYLGYAQTGSSSFCNSSNSFITYFETTGGGSGGPSNCYSGSATTGGVNSGTCAGQPKPSWQSVYNNPADSVRDLPDVALFAANGAWNHSVTICYSNTAGGTSTGGASCAGAPSTWTGIGGTSAASPFMAGIQALVNQYTGELQGNPNYAYYALGRAEYGASGNSACNSTLGNGIGSTCVFHDVTQGDMDVNCEKDGSTYYNCYNSGGTYGNLSTSNSSFLDAYAATSGWDFTTGLGTVNAYNLVTNWSSVAFTPVPAITGTVASYTYGTAQTADTLTGSVTGPGSFPTGSVLFSYGLSANPVSGYASIGTDALAPSAGCSASGTCTESVTQAFTPSATLTPGAYNIDTTYSSVNEDYTSGIVSATPVTFTVSKATPTAAITSATVGYGNPFSLGATDTGVSGGAAPTGTVTFTVNGVTVTGTPVCAGSGVVESCTESYTPPSTLTDGTYTITATFASDANYNASNTASGTLTVHMDNTTTTVTATPNSIASSGTTQLAATVKCSGTGSSVVGRMHGEVTASCTAVPTGTVTFTDTTNSASLGSCTLSAGTCTITGNGSAMAFGSNTITASYAAVTGEFNASSGTAAVTVTADVTSTSVTATPNTILATGSTMLAATVTDVTSSGTKPTGTVTFTDTTNSASLGSCTLSAGTCSATAQGSSMAAAGNTITASYAGVSGSFGASSGTTTVTVSALAASFGTMSFSPAASEPQGTSQAITISDTLTFNGAKPSGAVTFTLNSVGYTATCGATSPATCTATVPATTIAALAVNTYTVTAALAAGGGYSATSGASGTFTITAVATSSITFSAVSHNFGQVAVGTAATAFGLTITNTSATKAYPFSLVFTPANGFTSANNCGSSIAAGAHCQLDFYFTPTASGSVSATWSLAAETGFTYSPSNGGTLTGSGTTSGGVSLTSAGHNFGTVTVGQTSGAYGTELSNSTATAETISLGTVSAPFAMLTNCGTTLAAGSSCEIEFTFSPTTTSPVSVVVPLSGSPTAITSGGVALPSGGITLSGN